MDLKIQIRTADTVMKLISKKPFTPYVPFNSGKKEFTGTISSSEQPLPRKNPEELGVSSEYIDKFLRALESEKKSNIHQCMIVKDGAVISETAMNPYKNGVWHVTNSLCKTLTGMAVGILVSDRKIKQDDKLVSFFDKQMNALQKMRLGKITVENLLNMSSGLILTEIVLCAETDWLKACLDSGCSFEPGSKFSYNSMNSYLLSCIVEEITGITMFDFLKEKLFTPMGIKNICWESCPMGHTKGGWGAYMLPEDMAKLGLLLMRGGVWNGRQLISGDYVEAMTTKQMGSDTDDGYGYQIWMDRRPGAYLFNGMFGQNVHCLPDIDMIIVHTGGNDKLFGDCHANDIVMEYFGGDYMPESSLPADNSALKKLRETEKSLVNLMSQDILKTKRENAVVQKKNFFTELFRKRPQITSLPEDCALISGKSYVFDKCFVRLLPLFTCLMNNCYTEGISKLGFIADGENFFMLTEEGEEINRIKLGFSGKYEYSNVRVLGDDYTVAASAVFASDEDGNTVLKISLPFIECAGGRSLKVCFLPDGRIKVSWFEYPGKKMITDGAASMVSSLNPTILNQVRSKYDVDLIIEQAGNLAEPVCYASLENK